MDPERQPLLYTRSGQDLRYRRFRPLTPEEVLTSRDEATWRRWRFFMVIMFWAIMTMFLSGIATILLRAPGCPVPSTVPPVHLSFTPLLASTREEQPTWML